MALSEATSLTLAAVNGNATLELKQRALPYRPLTIGGKQRMEMTWYPGSPSATVQMLGPEEAPITMTGYWKDKFLAAVSSDFYARAFGDVAIATYNGEPITDVVTLVDRVDAMRRSGLPYKFTWDRIQRFGHISNFEVTWHNAKDAEWLLEFAVTAQEENAQAKPQSNRAAPSKIASAVQALEVEIDIAAFRVVPFDALSVAESFLAAIGEYQDLLTEYTNKVTSTANKLVSSVMAYPDGARRMASTMGQSLRSLSATATTITDSAVETWFYFAGGQDNSPIGQQVAASSVLEDLSQFQRQLQQTTVFGRYDIQLQMQQQQTASFLAVNDTDFRDVSTQFYGSQNNWIELMRYNGYTDSKIKAGELVWVPPQPTSGALGSGGDY